MKLKLRPKKAEKPEVPRQVADRWTPVIAQKGWTPVSDYFLRNYHRLRVSHTEAMVLIHLISFKWDAAAPFPALKTIGKRMGITIASVRTHLRNLEGKKLLHREMRVGMTNLFDLQGLFTALERLMIEDVEAKSAAENVTASDGVDPSGGPTVRKPR